MSTSSSAESPGSAVFRTSPHIKLVLDVPRGRGRSFQSPWVCSAPALRLRGMRMAQTPSASRRSPTRMDAHARGPRTTLGCSAPALRLGGMRMAQTPSASRRSPTRVDAHARGRALPRCVAPPRYAWDLWAGRGPDYRAGARCSQGEEDIDSGLMNLFQKNSHLDYRICPAHTSYIRE